MDGAELAAAWEARVPDFATLRELLLAQCDAWVELVEKHPDDGYLMRASYADTAGTPAAVVWAAALSQVFNHGTHHRGQITAAFSGAGLQFPSMDMQSLPDFGGYAAAG